MDASSYFSLGTSTALGLKNASDEEESQFTVIASAENIYA